MGWCWRRTRRRGSTVGRGVRGRTAPVRFRRPRRRAGIFRGLPVLLAVAAGAGCGGGAALDGAGASTAEGAPGPASSPEPGDVVARFLDAAGRRDHGAMARLFGTAAGPIGEQGSAFGCGLRRMGTWVGLGRPCLTAQEIELRMDVIARILAHVSHREGPAAAVAGRGRPAARVEVEITVRDGRVLRVPFVLIRTLRHGWLVEEVGLGRLTG